MASKLIEFFQDNKGDMSMSRLLSFLSFFPATVVVLSTKTNDALQWYVGAYAVGYVGGKAVDAFWGQGTVIKHGDIDADLN